MTPGEFQSFCDEVSEMYGVVGYNPVQVQRMYQQVRYCTRAEFQQAIDLMAIQEMKFPNMSQLLGYLRPAIFEAAKRKRAEVIKEDGKCELCQGTGMIIVTRHADKAKNEVTMRCGECRVAEVMGVLKHTPVYTDLGSRGVEPAILHKSLNANPGRGRIDEIRALPAAEREALLRDEPWLRWVLAMYGNKSFGVEQVAKVAVSEDDELAEFLE